MNNSKLALALLIAFFSSCSPEEQVGSPQGVPSAHVTDVARTASTPASDLREGVIVFTPPLRDWARAGATPTGPTRLRLFDGVDRELRITAHRRVANGGVFEGHFVESPGSSLVLAHVDDAVAGTMLIPGVGLFRVRTRAGGELRLTSLDPLKIPTERLPPSTPFSSTPSADALPAQPPPHDESAFDDTATGDTTGDGEATPAVASDVANTVVDIAVFYTPAAATANGGTSGVNALITAAVATANTAYTNSHVSLTLRLVQTAQTSYSESHALGTDLGRLQAAADGYMDEVHAARSAVKADIVSLIVTGASDAAGIGYLWTTGMGASFVNYAFNVAVDAYADANLTLAHEVGHNMGCGHAAGDGGSGAYAYSYGYKFTASGSAYRTVMAYAPGLRVPYFSNPSVSYLGAATGVTNTADNALTLNTTRATIAATMGGLTASDQLWGPVTAGDFNADGQTDIVWRNSGTGRVIVWFMSGATRTSTATIWSGDAAWVPITAADLNADGKPDLVWRNSSTGRVIVWYLNGVTTTSTAAIWSGDANWVPVTSGDFNADGKPDLIWRYAPTGRVIVWMMNGATMASTAQLWAGDAAWVPVSTGDFNADNKTDIIWRNTASGRVIAWLMNGVVTSSTAVVWSGSSDWVPRATGGFNGDSNTDTVWRNSSNGRVIVWLMSGTSASSTTAIWE